MVSAVLHTRHTRLAADAMACMPGHGDAKAVITERACEGAMASALTLYTVSTRWQGVTSGMGNFLTGLEHRAESLERQRALLRREVRAEEQHRAGGTGLVPAPQSPPCFWRGAVDDQLLE
jgi:hypothetical protein